VAFSLVDFNGDGNLSGEEFGRFYKDVYLPVVEFTLLSKKIDFEAVNKQSLLHRMHWQVKDRK
jgi:hypothetical protein